MAERTDNYTNERRQLSLQLPHKTLELLSDIALMEDVSVEELVIGFIDDGIEDAQPRLSHKVFVKDTQDRLRQHKVPEEAVEEFPEKFS